MHLCPCFAQQRCTFQRRLARTDDRDRLPCESGKVFVLASMGESGVAAYFPLQKIAEHIGQVGVGNMAAGDNNRPGGKFLSARKRDQESIAIDGKSLHQTPHNATDVLPLKPSPILDESFQGYGMPLIRDGLAEGPVVVGDGRSGLGCRKTRGLKRGFQIHTPRHVTLPAGHRFAANHGFDIGVCQVSGQGKSVWPRSHDRDIDGTRRLKRRQISLLPTRRFALSYFQSIFWAAAFRLLHKLPLSRDVAPCTETITHRAAGSFKYR